MQYRIRFHFQNLWLPLEDKISRLVAQGRLDRVPFRKYLHTYNSCVFCFAYLRRRQLRGEVERHQVLNMWVDLLEASFVL